MSKLMVVSAVALVGGLMALAAPTSALARIVDGDADRYCGNGPGQVCKEVTTEECVEWRTVSGGGTIGTSSGGVTLGQACARTVTVKDTYYWTDSGTAIGGGGGSTRPRLHQQ